MKNMKVLAVVLSALILAFADPIAVTHAKNSTMLEGIKILGGMRVDISLVPSQVSLIEIIVPVGVRLLGSGTIIKSNVILIAAHCVAKEDVTELHIHSGSNYFEKEGRIIDILRHKIHPGYKHTAPECFAFDLALLFLAESAIAGGLPAAVIVLWDTDATFTPGTFGALSGWGAIEEDGPYPGFLKRVALPVVSYQTCVAHYGTLVATHTICTGYSRGGRDGCRGDSGAGLVVGTKLAGVFAFGKGCGRKNTPSGFTSVPVFRNWIRAEAGV